jgi:arylformamidase
MFVNLTYPLTKNGIVLENNVEPPVVIPRSRFDQGKHSNTSYFKMFAHTGTHLDAPWHFIQDGKKISDFSITDFIYSKVALLKIPANPGEPIDLEPFLTAESILRECDCLLIRTGFSALRRKNSGKYFSENPGFSLKAASFLSTFQNLRCIGMDIPSVENVPQGRLSGFPVHKVLLSRQEPMVLLEEGNLDAIEDKHVKRLFIFPLMLEGLEAAPVTAVAEV